MFSGDGGTFARTGERDSIVIFTAFDKIRQKLLMIRDTIYSRKFFANKIN